MTPEQLVEASSLNGQIDRNTLLNLAYTVLDMNPLATPDDSEKTHRGRKSEDVP